MMKPKKKITQRDFLILISFLNDKSSETRVLVKKQLKAVLRRHPRFRRVLTEVSDPQLKNVAEGFFEEVRYEEWAPEFERLFAQGDNLDLEKGLYLLAKTEYPDLTPNDIAVPIDRMAKDVDRLIARQDPLPTRPITAMRRYLFDEQKFRGNKRDYYDPQNLYLNRVLKRKAGIPISLSCIYLLVAWRLRLLVHGVGLPGHFILGHRVPRGVVYIDAFDKGRILRAKDCEVMVRRLGTTFRHEYLDPVSNLQILSRTIVNLINVYSDKGKAARAQALAKLFHLIK